MGGVGLRRGDVVGVVWCYACDVLVRLEWFFFDSLVANVGCLQCCRASIVSKNPVKGMFPELMYSSILQSLPLDSYKISSCPCYR